jgi:D-proline reductase (dithiol) PrdB
MISTMTNQSAPQCVPYMERSRLYYEAQGFDTPYVWAHFDEVPFAPLAKPLSECTLALFTTSSLYDRTPEDPREVLSGDTADPPQRLYANDLAWDKRATHLNDLNSYFPIDHLQALLAEGRIGQLAKRFHCVPTEYSQRRTMTIDAPELLKRCREDEVDVALLVPL